MAYYQNPEWERRKAGEHAKQSARVSLDCIHLDEEVIYRRGRAYRECNKGHGPQCACSKPQTCGPQCSDYESPSRSLKMQGDNNASDQPSPE